MMAIATEPMLRRNRRRNTRRTTTTSTATTATPAAAPASSPVTALPAAIPCYNYFEMFPEEVGATGNVEVTDSAEVHQWKLVGRRVSQAVAEAEGGCVKVSVAGLTAPVYYNITASDDEVYGRAAYLPRDATTTTTSMTLKDATSEPFAFLERSCDACTTDGDESEGTSSCNSPCVSCTSMRCVYP